VSFPSTPGHQLARVLSSDAPLVSGLAARWLDRSTRSPRRTPRDRRLPHGLCFADLHFHTLDGRWCALLHTLPLPPISYYLPRTSLYHTHEHPHSAFKSIKHTLTSFLYFFPVSYLPLSFRAVQRCFSPDVTPPGGVEGSWPWPETKARSATLLVLLLR